MTPKEKAKELIEKMDVIHYMKLGGKNKDSKGLPISMHNDQIKQCALVAVNECLNTCVESMIIYWIEVKQEIENEL